MKKRICFIWISAILLLGIGGYLTSRLLGKTDTNSVGEMTVSAGGQELTALKCWSFSLHDGLSGDAFPLMQQDLLDKLETIAYAMDLTVSFNEKPMSTTYYVYGDNFYTHIDGFWNIPTLNLPSTPGLYILRVQATWGAVDNYEGYDYLCKVLIQ